MVSGVTPPATGRPVGRVAEAGIRHVCIDPLGAADPAKADRPALIADGETVSYGSLRKRATDVAAHLAALGVRGGDRVALVAPPTLGTAVALHGIAAAGAVAVLLDPRLPAALLWARVEGTGPRVVLSPAGGPLGAREPGSVREVAPGLLAVPGPRDGPLRDPSSAPPAGTAATVVFTSGTSGTPKAALHTWAQHLASARASAARLGTGPGERWLLCLPPSHVGGLAVLLRAALAGSAVVLLPSFDPAAVVSAIRKHRVTGISVVPTQLSRLLDAEQGAWPEHLRTVLVGGAHLPASLTERARSAGLPLAPTYGLTEASSQVATLDPGAWRADPGAGTVGAPVPGTRIRIVDPEGRPLPDGADGEIEVLGPTVFAGYLDDPVAAAGAFRGGWLRTGDVGRMSGGHLAVLGRRDDLIVSGGDNVYPPEVESALLAHPAVVDAVVFGRPDPEWGQRVEAIVVLRGPCAEEELRAFCRERLGPFSTPRRVAFADRLPRTASGKLDRSAARSQGSGAGGGG